MALLLSHSRVSWLSSVCCSPSQTCKECSFLETGNGADVAFEVPGETFTAHRWLFAARYPAFSAELLASPTTESAGAGVVRVNKMERRVFNALLTFMYSDTLPETAEQEGAAAVAQHLLVAAHRYGMERLKLLWEKLCQSIDAGTAVSILPLAEPLGCKGLKDACLDFLSRSPANLKVTMAMQRGLPASDSKLPVRRQGADRHVIGT